MGRLLKINIGPKRNHEPWNSEEALSRALAERERFLTAYPQYHAYQREIDRTLDKAGSAENRMAVLALLMEAKLVELHHQLVLLNRILVTCTA